MTDTEKWKKPFIRTLPLELKVFWFYILDDCDHAGVWHVDLDVCTIRLGFSIDTEVALKWFGDKILPFDNGTKWFIVDFIPFQYGELTPTNKMWKPVSTTLNKYNLMGHISPINGVKVQVQEQDIVKVKEKEEPIGQKFKLEQCVQIVLLDKEWVMNASPTKQQLDDFVKHLLGRAEYEKNPLDFKSHFYSWRNKQKPDEKALVIKPLKA